MESRNKARGQGQGHRKNPRPRTAFSRTDTLEAKDQGHKRSALQKKRSSQKFFRRSQKKKVFAKIFPAISTKKRFPKNVSSIPQNFNNSKDSAVLEPRTGQGQGLQNVSSRTPPLPIRSEKSYITLTAFGKPVHLLDTKNRSFSKIFMKQLHQRLKITKTISNNHIITN